MMPRRPSGTGILPVRTETPKRNASPRATAKTASRKDSPPGTRWMESQNVQSSHDATQFPPLPKGEGRGEGEGDVTNSHSFHFDSPSKSRWFRLSLLLSALFAVAAMPPPSQPIMVPPEQAAKEGHALVDDMLSQSPDASTTTGVLAIRTKTDYKEIPIRFQTLVTSTNWVSVYSTAGADRSHSVYLKVVHTDGQPNRYFIANVNPPPTDTNQFRELKTTDLSSPFVDGSDFSIADLGLEFLHWPDQKLLQKEMRRSRSCRVLESTNPNPRADGYAKVKSWVDNESHGILLAQAFDVKGNKLKEFVPGDFSKSKATGQWQLGKMQITTLKTGSTTTVKFDVDK
jgi:hypothetical protein